MVRCHAGQQTITYFRSIRRVFEQMVVGLQEFQTLTADSKINNAKGKPGESRGRKAEDLRRLRAMIVWLPKTAKGLPSPKRAGPCHLVRLLTDNLGYQDTGFRYAPW